MYCVGIGEPDKSPRYISTCDQYGHTTTSVKLFQFTQNQVNEVITQLRSRFVFKLFVLDQNGNVIFDTNKPKQKQLQEAQASGLSIKIRV
jgi:hypothetical protein